MTSSTFAKILAERLRQDERWGPTQFAAMDPERVLAVLVEEVGEAAQAVLNLDRPPTIHPNARRRRLEHLEIEIIQVAAVAAAWLDQCFNDRPDRYEPEMAAAAAAAAAVRDRP